MLKNPTCRWSLALASLLALVPIPLAAQSDGNARLAREVTIHRDRWGIPHVFARTDAGAAFGFAYAQAEDYFARLELNYVQALGRGAELEGDRKSTRLNSSH